MNFTKMHGLGNDFIVINNIDNTNNLTKQQITKLAHRNFGIGFDQLLSVESSSLDGVDFKYRIFNADGSEVEQCGNGARCFARFVYAKNLTNKTTIIVETMSSIITLKIIAEENMVQVDMGLADFNLNTIIKPQNLTNVINTKKYTYLIANLEMGLVSMGNPHAVLIVDDSKDEIQTRAVKIQNDNNFINGVNVGFMQIISRDKIKLRVYERGSGETLACGSGACAAVSYGIALGLLADKVIVKLRGGECIITKINNNIFLSGPAEFVFEGRVKL